jgi:hypothetical protein
MVLTMATNHELRLNLSDTIIFSASKDDDIREFHVPTSLATKSSKFIKAALSRGWKEAQEKRISLPDTDPDTLEGYLNWIYTQRITLQHNSGPCEPCETKGTPGNCVYAHSLSLLMMYTLGDYLNDLQFCNAVVDQMVAMKNSEFFRCVIPADAIGWVWEHTASDTPLRNYCLEIWKAILPQENMRSYLED